MDNLTHSLVGAVLGQMGLKKKTGLAMPTLILAANLPDIDAACAVYGIESLPMRRGITHGPIALLVLPVLLWAAMIAFDRWQERRGKRPSARLPIHPGWLLALAYIGCISHPALDWLNNYGIRLLEPFSHRWFYGDTLFIIDIWIWAALAVSLWLSLRRERRGAGDWRRPAWIGFTAVSAYIFVNGLITGYAEARAADRLAATGRARIDLVVASPPPLRFWQRDIFWRGAVVDGSDAGTLSLDLARSLDIRAAPEASYTTHAGDPRVAAAAARSAEARAFLFWSRMPVAAFGADGTLTLTDQRFRHPLAVDRFKVLVSPEKVPTRAGEAPNMTP
ncbi:MAG: metal-dependent hydrolase [Sphingopyxis sp.]|nr:metal-dependent hydrolase [Sphingopyxis sp.]